MKAADENMVDLYRTTRRHNQEDSTLREPQIQRTACPLQPVHIV
jgi:hypothetical protein